MTTVVHLIALHPHWVTSAKGAIVGLRFDCPHCRETKAKDPARIFVELEPPMSADAPRPSKPWQRTGDTFETLTLSPSIDFKHPKSWTDGEMVGWHGFVVDGKITP